MKGYYEIKYSVIIKDDNGRLLFCKKSLMFPENKNESYLEPTDNPEILSIFYKLFPVLKEFPRDQIIIIRGWQTFHPADSIPENLYDEQEDRMMTAQYHKWHDIAIVDKLYLDRQAQAHCETLARYGK